ncbi:MAG: carbohydrate ABC transporter permease [Christensenellales bacterium]
MTRKGKYFKHYSLTDRLFIITTYALLSIIALLVLYPLIYVLSSSFSSPEAVMSGKVRVLPVDFSLEGYRAVLKYEQVWTGYLNSIIYTVSATILGVVMTIMLAFPLSRKNILIGTKVINGYILFTMLFSGGLIPNYFLVRNLGMLNTRFALIIPGALSAYYIIIARTFFTSTIPDEIYEAAIIDGCSDARFMVSIVIPLSMAIIAVLTLFYAVIHWNAYMPALLYLRNKELFPLQIVLRNILLLSQKTMERVDNIRGEMAAQGMEALLKYSLIVVGSAPMLIAYPFVQKHFVKGVMIGSLKG